MTKPARNAASASTTRTPTKSPITPAAAARVQSAVALRNGGGVPKGSYAARLQQTAAHKASK